MGTMNLEHVGTMTVTRYVDKKDNLVRKCPNEISVIFKKAGWSGAGKFCIEATFKAGNDQYKIHGKWNEVIYLENLTKGSKKVLYQPTARPEESEYLYNFTNFSLQSNNVTDELKA